MNHKPGLDPIDHPVQLQSSVECRKKECTHVLQSITINFLFIVSFKVFNVALSVHKYIQEKKFELKKIGIVDSLYSCENLTGLTVGSLITSRSPYIIMFHASECLQIVKVFLRDNLSKPEEMYQCWDFEAGFSSNNFCKGISWSPRSNRNHILVYFLKFSQHFTYVQYPCIKVVYNSLLKN